MPVTQHRFTLMLLLLPALIFGFTSLGTLGHEGTPAAQCVSASPAASLGTLAAFASPTLTKESADHAASLATPVTQSCLTVTLKADNTKAGPRTLTVMVSDADGAPVSDAQVVILTHHLEMDHGTSTNEAVAQGSGEYVATKVALGMGGSWLAEVVVTRSGSEPVAVPFVVELEGPA